jgi:predicted Zn-dependent peptidase
MRPLAYKEHPYQWATIGKDISHIEQATMEDVIDFFFSFYAPNNAILSVVGDIENKQVFDLTEKWFGDLGKRNIRDTGYKQEPTQTEKGTLSVERDVPQDVIMMAFQMSSRFERNYDIANMISDVLSNGESSRLIQHLVKEQQVFSSISAFISGSLDKGLFVVKGDLSQGITMEQAESAIWQELQALQSVTVSDYELEKIKNRLEAMEVFDDMSLINKAMQLSYFEMLGDAGLINNQVEMMRSIQAQEMKLEAKRLFVPKNCSVLYYHSKK